jgi:hypothetical protein
MDLATPIQEGLVTAPFAAGEGVPSWEGGCARNVGSVVRVGGWSPDLLHGARLGRNRLGLNVPFNRCR